MALEFKIGIAPLHDERRLCFSEPEDLRKVLKKYPLDKGFIDYIRDNGFKIVYEKNIPVGYGAVVYYSKELEELGYHGHIIYLGISHSWNIDNKCDLSGDEKKLIDLSLMHELIHVAIPDWRLTWRCQVPFIYKIFDKVIDEIAEQYLKDKDFLDYVKKTIPFEKN